MWNFHNNCSSDVIVPVGEMQALQPKQHLYGAKSIFRIQIPCLILMHSSASQATGILSSLNSLVIETQRTKKTYETIFSSTCSKCTFIIVCCREIITNGIKYSFKLVFLANSMGVNNSMMGKNSAVYSAFFNVHNVKINNFKYSFVSMIT